MKTHTLKSILFFVLALNSLCITAQGVLPSSDTFRLKNVGSGLFLTDPGTSGIAVTMTNLSEDDQSTHWTFVQRGALYNIDSRSSNTGILRAPGNTNPPDGDYVIVLTSNTNTGSDKEWTIHYNSMDDTYRFQKGTSSRYMYHDANGTVTNVPLVTTDNRFDWELVPYVGVAPDEDTSTDLSCSSEFENKDTRNVDIPNPVNVGTVDDRSCYADYSEVDVYGKTWGVYNITDGSNHWDAPNTLQPRIERFLPRSQETGVGSYTRFTGTFRILEVGDAGSFGQDGTYIAQAKGKHTGGGGAPDPAICLYRAHPVYGTGDHANKQVSFDIYAERILERGGTGSRREVVFLKNVVKNVETSFELEVGFRLEETIFGTRKVHYCDAVIGGEAFKWNIPDPERGTESGIRYGAYRVKGGRAQIRWADDTTYQNAEVIDNGSYGTTANYYKLKNVATGKYLMRDGSTLVPSILGEGDDKEWRFVDVEVAGENYYNIDAQLSGVIRFHGTSSNPLLTSTTFRPRDTSVDKIWTVYNNGDGSYSFETRDTGRYLYHYVDENIDVITHFPYNDAPSKWILESTTLSSDEASLKTTSIKIYPNPAKDKFILNFQNINSIKQVEIYNILGKRVYQNTPSSNVLEVDSSGFQTGVYLVKAFSDNSKVFHSKLVIN